MQPPHAWLDHSYSAACTHSQQALSLGLHAQEVAHCLNEKSLSDNLQPLYPDLCSQMRKKLRSAVQLLAHITAENFPLHRQRTV